MKAIALVLLVVLAFPLFAQKKLVPAFRSELTGINLPKESLQDKRLLSVTAAVMLLEAESKNDGTEINSAEYFVLPSENISHYTADSLNAGLKKAGWQISVVTSDPKYFWLQKGDRYIIAYFSADSKSSSLYFGEPKNTPVLRNSQQLTVTQSNSQTNTNAVTPAVASVTVVTTAPAATGENGKPATDNSTNIALPGDWVKISMIQPDKNNPLKFAYNKQQYKFNTDGTYQFYGKTFDMSMTSILLKKEEGTYILKGNLLTIDPKTSVIESWSKKDGADKWGTLLSSDKLKLERTTYTTTMHYFSGIDEWNLVLQTNTKTGRDGEFSTNTTFTNAYYYAAPTSSTPLIELPGNTIQRSPTNPVSKGVSNTFTFSTTNFDDGWTSTIQDDWVLVTKGKTTVYLWYALPYNASDFSGTGLVARDYYWDNHVTRYFNVQSKQYRDNGETISALKPEYVEGWAIDKKTGERKFIAMTLSISPNIAFITLATAPEEATLRQLFPKANDWNQSDLAGMKRYNQFSIAKSDIVGTWTESGGAAMNYYNAYTGSYAGMGVASTSAKFIFNPDGSYYSEHKGATGMVGNLNTFQQEFKGNYQVSNWELTMDKRFNGNTEIYFGYFEAVRGGRVLHLNDKKYTGSWYHLVKQIEK